MNRTSLYDTIIICTAILAVSCLAALDILRGGDGATITGAFAVISALVGYKLGVNQTTNINSNGTPSNSSSSNQGSGNNGTGAAS